MTVIHDPNSVLAMYISMMRNMFLLSSIGLSALVLSNNFKDYKKFVQVLSVIILIYCIMYGLKSNIDFIEYLNFTLNQKDIPKLYLLQLNSSKGWVHMSYIYMFIIFILICVILFRKLIIII